MSQKILKLAVAASPARDKNYLSEMTERLERLRSLVEKQQSRKRQSKH